MEVELDGSPWRVLAADAVVRAGLGVGRTLDRPLARQLARERRRAEALRHAGRALGTRDLSREELDERLTRRGVTAAARADVVETLERGGLIDDERFAVGRAEALARRGYGDAAIRHDLERRGISYDALAAAVAGLEPERERAERLVAAQGAGAAAARRLAARGFGEDAIDAAFDGRVAGDG